MKPEPRPLHIAIPQAQLLDLKSRLALTRYPDAQTVADWDQGVPLAYVRELATYWQEQYDWRRCEARLNAWPNFLIEIELLDNVTLYWLTNSAASSARLYWHSLRNFSAHEIHLPTGCSLFPLELMRLSRRWAERRFRNIVYWNELPRGGHFAAMERTQLFVQEVRTCFAGMLW